MQLFAVILSFLALAAGFALYLVKRDRGEREPVAALWTAFGLGAVGVVMAGLLELNLLPDLLHQELGLGTLAWVVLAIALIEELSKCVLLLWYLRGKRFFNEHTDGVIYFALAGLGFGLPENLLYTVQYGAETGLVRLLMTPLFHAATTGIIGYALAKRKLDGMTRLRLVIVFGWVIVIHAVYDFGLFSQIPVLMLLSVMVTIGLGLGLFLLYLHARSLDQLVGLSAVGNNSFCRSCGHPNPKHNLYCSACGKHA